MNTKYFFIKIFLLSLVLTGCTNKNDGTIRWIDGSVMIADKEKIRKNQKMLLAAKNTKDLEDKIDEGIVFDGTVYAVDVNVKTGLRKVNFNINKILIGDLDNKEFIIVHTPSIENGGVLLQKNKTYRVFTVYLNNEYRTWASAGTVEISQKPEISLSENYK